MTRIPAERFAPGGYIHDEMQEREWTEDGLAALLQLTPDEMAALLSGEKRLSLGLAEKLGKAFGTSWKFWYNLEKAYRKERIGEKG